MKNILFILLIILLLAGGGWWYMHRAPEVGEQKSGIANPASQNCVEKGGTLEIVNEDGGQAGYCHLPDGSTCEEWAFMRGECGGTASPSARGALDEVLLPLFPGVTWSAPAEASEGDLEGYKATALAAKDTMDIASATKAFTEYYEKKLTAAGWKKDISREAGGPGASIEAYEKGGAHILVGFTSDLKAGGESEPSRCPCDVALFVFSGSAR